MDLATGLACLPDVALGVVPVMRCESLGFLNCDLLALGVWMFVMPKVLGWQPI